MTLTAIYIYPLKSARGTGLPEADVETLGLAGDRRWMLVDENDTFLSQREHAKLALVETRLSAGSLTVSAPEMPPLEIQPSQAWARTTVRIWRDDVEAAVAEHPASTWFSNYLGTPCRLVYLDDPASRPVDPSHSKDEEFVSFADGFPLLLTASDSLDELNRRLDEPLPMNRFRPNVVVSGGGAFAEDEWKHIQIGEAEFRVAKPCARCVVTTVDQQTGEPGKEPLRTLATFRKRDGKVHFGQNLIPLKLGRIRVGDPVEVLD